jgi:hypothetical protein
MDSFPLGRGDELMTETLGDELLVYDERNNQAHSLRREVQSVWKLCDERRPTEQIATDLDLRMSLVVQAVWELGECGLLEGTDAERIAPLRLVAGNTARQNELIDRRAMLRRAAALGGVAALAAPRISTVRVATAQAATSAGPNAIGTFSSQAPGADPFAYAISATTANPSGSTGTVPNDGSFFYFQPDGSLTATSPYITFADKYVENYVKVYVGAVGTGASYTLTDLTTPAADASGTLTAGNNIVLPVALGDVLTVELSFD